jgi:hypothetical protein
VSTIARLQCIPPQNQEHVSRRSRRSFAAFDRFSMRFPPFEPGFAFHRAVTSRWLHQCVRHDLSRALIQNRFLFQQPASHLHTPKLRQLVRSFRVRSSSGQQAVDIYLVLCAYIDMPVHHCRDVEAEGEASAVTCGVLAAIVEFTSDVRRVVSIQNRGSLG